MDEAWEFPYSCQVVVVVVAVSDQVLTDGKGREVPDNMNIEFSYIMMNNDDYVGKNNDNS